MDETKSPRDNIDDTDSGDDTIRRFRYQLVQGALLIVGCICEELEYIAIWCEQHEDFLAQKKNGVFDGYQIKTSTPENGPWTIKDDGLKKSIKRFCRLNKSFPDKIDNLYFVSNVDFEKSAKKGFRCPKRFIDEAILNKDNKDENFVKEFNELREYCGCTEQELIETLRKVKLTKGSSLAEMDAVVTLSISKIDGCSDLSVRELEKIKDLLIQKVHDASSLKVDNALDYWYCLKEDQRNLKLLTKKLDIEELNEIIKANKNLIFMYIPSIRTKLLSRDSDLSVLEKKMIKGGLNEHIGIMKEQVNGTDNYLIKFSYRNPEEFESKCDHLSTKVEAISKEVDLEFIEEKNSYGLKKYKLMIERFRKLASEEKENIFEVPFECLMGISGILTDDCKIWWSPPFDLN